MSYLRYGHPLRYVKADSDDYIFSTEDNKGRECVEDYGDITNNGLVELLCHCIDECYDELMREYLKKKLAEKLGVELRKKQLTDEQVARIEQQHLKESRKNFESIIKAHNLNASKKKIKGI